MNDAQEAGKIKAQTAYDAASDHYEDEALGFWERYGQRTVDRLRLAQGATVLDVGCGSGASALPAAATVAPNGRVIGVDLSEKLLDIARAKAARRGLGNVEFRLGDMTSLGYPDRHFDAVVSVFSIFFVQEMEKQVAELWRMVRPGGQLAITTWGSNFWQPLYGRWMEAIQTVRPDLYTAFNPWDRIATPETLRQLLHDGGVTNAEVVAENGMQPLQSPHDWWAIVLGSGLRWTADQLGAEAAQVRDHNVKWAAEHNTRAIQTNVIYATATKSKP